jgi:hypothetical protein
MKNLLPHGLVAVFWLFALADSAAAAVVQAQSGSRDDIQAAVDAAEAGDTLVIPPGVFSFTGTVTIPRALTVTGAGPTVTVLMSTNDSATSYVSMFRVTGSNVTIRDLSFVGMPQGSGYIRDSGITFSDSQDFVVTNCHFRDFGIAGVSVGGADSKGVISGCRIIDVFRPEINNIGYGVQVVGGEEINWNRPLDLGSDRFAFVEDCYFSGTRHAIASTKGSRYVFRFNETYDPRPDNAQHIDAHGLEYGSERGSRAFEIYGNRVQDTDGVASWAGITIRGGDGIVAQNAFFHRIHNPIYLSNRLDGSSTCDYPNLDQTTELYVWDNTHDGTPIGLTIRSDHACLFELGRDYFLHAPPGYVPFPYPHPLLAGLVPSDGGVDPDGGADADAQDDGGADPQDDGGVDPQDDGMDPQDDAADPQDDGGGDASAGDPDGGPVDASAGQDGAQQPEPALHGGCGCQPATVAEGKPHPGLICLWLLACLSLGVRRWGRPGSTPRPRRQPPATALTGFLLIICVVGCGRTLGTDDSGFEDGDEDGWSDEEGLDGDGEEEITTDEECSPDTSAGCEPACIPKCGPGWNCGRDECGGMCGECFIPGGEQCFRHGCQLEEPPTCWRRMCSWDDYCGTCPADWHCISDAHCYPEMGCDAVPAEHICMNGFEVLCRDDKINYIDCRFGHCGFNEATGKNSCLPIGCLESCFGKNCGDDGCGTSCGDCGTGTQCSASGVCVPIHCSDVPAEGTCIEGQRVFCDGCSVIVEDCLARGRLCSYDDCSRDHRCRPIAGEMGCDNLPQHGHCRNDYFYWCVQDEVRVVDCQIIAHGCRRTGLSSNGCY